MAFLFLGHKAAQFQAGLGSWTDSTTVGTFDSNYTDSSILAQWATNQGNGHRIGWQAGVQAEVWFHANVYNWGSTVNDDGPCLMFYGDTGDMIGGIYTGTGTNNGRRVTSAAGASAAQVGSTYTQSNSLGLIDVHVEYDLASSGNIVVTNYWNGTIVGSASTTAITSNSSTGIDHIMVGGWDHDSFYMSEIIVSDSDTRGMRLGQMTPDGAGNYSAWENAGTDIGFSKNFTGISSAVAADRESWSLSSYSGPASPTTIHAVVNQVYGTPGNSGPSQVDSFLRISSTDYDSGALTPEAMKACTYEWTTNPNTAGAWATTDFAALEAGVEAVT